MTYTPTTEQVRLLYANSMDPDGFDRWYADVIRKAKAEALEEAADAMDADPEFRDPLRLKSDWLRNRAQQLKEES